MVDIVQTITVVAPWIIFVGSIVAVLVLNAIIVRYFSDKTKSQWIPSITAWLGMTFAFVCLCLTPVDIFASGLTETAEQANSPIFSTLRLLYLIFYATVIGFAFIILPFVYFFYEAEEEDKSFGRQCFDGFKFSVGFFIILLVCVFVGLFISIGANNGGNNMDFNMWIQTMLDTTNRGERAILFCLGCLSCLGMLVWITYTAFGMMAMPIGMIKGRLSVQEEKEDFTHKIHNNQAKRSLLDDDELGGTRGQTLRRDRDVLEVRTRRLEAAAGKCCSKFARCMRPFEIVFGILFTLISLFLAVCLILAAVEQILSNYCSVQCGFILAEPRIKNPIDQLLVILHRYFPLDFALVSFIILYFFFCTVNGGLRRIQIRCFCMKLYDYSRNHTPPQGLILGAFLTMLAILATNVQFLNLAPQYAYWGGRTFFNATDNSTKPCSIEYSYSQNITANACQMTQIGRIYTTLKWDFPYFGSGLYFISWGFILTFIVGTIVAICAKPESNIEEHSDDDMDIN